MIPVPLQGDIRAVRADNPGPFTLDGTRTFVVGRRRPAIVDPGPNVESHVRAVVRLVEGADDVTLLLTHGHADHAGGAAAVAEALRGLDVPVRTAGVGHRSADALSDRDGVETDVGALVALATPGHTPDHLSFFFPARGVLFPGDLLLGEGDTTWVAGYAGCVADYLGSLERLRSFDLRTILPTHGPPLSDPVDALDRFEAHRLRRIEQVEAALGEHPDADAEALVDHIYGDELPTGMRGPAVESVRALLDHVRPEGRGD